MAWDSKPNHTNTTEHKRLRQWATHNLDPICNHPGCHETEGLELDHIVNWKAGGTHTTDNIQWLCRYHHNIKTQKEAAARRQPYKRKPKPPLGT